ncbi:unnamed protein product [Acanthoscelides obtectus]|uniref:DUF4371 domain-containing protein n=1 Tax=Acanthoscelides obtectus TaxID=200917 RepID=A0A9P0K5Q6_ACAOB|nr:unnamed protein product [Acanthoscelides obtectus]CAK1632602.1 SCAN domain-containing protein 3 [Acanthoscelides obtectus]
MRLDKSGSYHKGVSQYLKAAFEIAFMIAKQNKPHTIGEELIKPCVKHRIDEIAADIKSQIINKVKLSPFFAFSCDESTDIVNCAQLIVYVRYIGGDIIQEEILYSQSLTAGSTSEDIFNSISNFVEKNDLDWKKLIGLCTDGAPAMIGVRTGLAKKLNEKNPAMVTLTSKTLPQKLRQTLDSAIRIVNYIKSSALNSRLFTLLCEDLDSDHKVLLFHTDVL